MKQLRCPNCGRFLKRELSDLYVHYAQCPKIVLEITKLTGEDTEALIKMNSLFKTIK